MTLGTVARDAKGSRAVVAGATGLALLHLLHGHRPVSLIRASCIGLGNPDKYICLCGFIKKIIFGSPDAHGVLDRVRYLH